jgi:hypothetical protein
MLYRGRKGAYAGSRGSGETAGLFTGETGTSGWENNQQVEPRGNCSGSSR